MIHQSRNRYAYVHDQWKVGRGEDREVNKKTTKTSESRWFFLVEIYNCLIEITVQNCFFFYRLIAIFYTRYSWFSSVVADCRTFRFTTSTTSILTCMSILSNSIIKCNKTSTTRNIFNRYSRNIITISAIFISSICHSLCRLSL